MSNTELLTFEKLDISDEYNKNAPQKPITIPIILIFVGFVLKK